VAMAVLLLAQVSRLSSALEGAMVAVRLSLAPSSSVKVVLLSVMLVTSMVFLEQALRQSVSIKNKAKRVFAEWREGVFVFIVGVWFEMIVFSVLYGKVRPYGGLLLGCTAHLLGRTAHFFPKGLG